MSDLVRCSIAVFGQMVRKKFHEKREKDRGHITKSLISFFNFSKKLIVFPEICQLVYQTDPMAYQKN